MIARFDDERRADASTSACARCPTSPPPPTATSARRRRCSPTATTRTAARCNTVGGGRRGYEIVDGPRRLERAPRRGGGRARARDGVGPAPGRHARRRPAHRASCGSSASRSRPTTSPTRWPRPRASTSREATIRERLGFVPDDANVALLWLNDPRKADVTLTQARAVSFGLGKLQFVTREGVRVLLSQAAGIVISLLVAFSLVALVAAGTMLAAGAHAEVQRRLSAFGVQRALGFTPGADRRRCRPPRRRSSPCRPRCSGSRRRAGRGRPVGRAARRAQRAAARRGPARAARARAGSCVVAIVVGAATWPAWRAARRPPAEILRGGDADAARRRARRAAACSASARASRPPRAGAGSPRWRRSPSAPGVVVLMLALASLLERLRDDPGTVGKRYQLTRVGARVPARRRSATCRASTPRARATRSRPRTRSGSASRCGWSPTPATTPSSRRRRSPRAGACARRARSRSGSGWPTRSGCGRARRSPPSCPSGAEVRFRVGGRRARAGERRPDRLGAAASGCSRATPGLEPGIVVRLDPGADRAAVTRALTDLGAPPRAASAATTRNGQFLAVLAAVLRGVGLAVGLVCLYALVQALTMTARERRGAVALLRACGGDARAVATVLAGAAGGGRAAGRARRRGARVGGVRAAGGAAGRRLRVAAARARARATSRSCCSACAR